MTPFGWPKVAEMSALSAHRLVLVPQRLPRAAGFSGKFPSGNPRGAEFQTTGALAEGNRLWRSKMGRSTGLEPATPRFTSCVNTVAVSGWFRSALRPRFAAELDGGVWTYAKQPDDEGS